MMRKAWLLLICGVTSCGGMNPSLRAAAARHLACDESRLEEEEALGPRTVRVSGCGKSALFSCQSSKTAEPAAPGAPPDEREARQPMTPPAMPCTWDVAK